MKSLKQFIEEKLVIKKSTNFNHKYFPQTKKELREIIEKRIKDEGPEVDLNNIDVSRITDMSDLFFFEDLEFNGDISHWDVRNVTNMDSMFYGCKEFNQDISEWDVSNVTDMHQMFAICKSFNQDISNWDVSNVTDMRAMFFCCENFNQDISQWDVSKVKYFDNIFTGCYIDEKYKSKFK